MTPRQLAKRIYDQAGDEALRAKPEADRRQWVGERAKLEGMNPLGVQETVSRVEALLRDNARPAAEALSRPWSGRMRGELPVAKGTRSRMFLPRGK